MTANEIHEAHFYVMQFGKHKGKKISEVPASYLLFLAEQPKCYRLVELYVLMNRRLLLQQKEEEQECETLVPYDPFWDKE